MSFLHQNDMEENLKALVKEDDTSVSTFTNLLKPNTTCARGGANAPLALS